jgi:hypothetical protein
MSELAQVTSRELRAMPSRALILLCVCPDRVHLSACDVSVSLQSSSSSVGILIDTHTSLIRKMLIAVQQTEGIDTLETHMFAHTQRTAGTKDKTRIRSSPVFSALAHAPRVCACDYLSV